jgi:dTDP-4-amino-4,6-dideoxygalactose transaminase
MQHMLNGGVATRRGIMCAHREPAYAHVGHDLRLPHSEAAQDRCILLPLFSDITDEEMDRVAETLASACERS